MTKPFYLSLTLLGAVLSLVSAILAAAGYGDVAASVGVLASLVVTGGRARASTALTLGKRRPKARKGHTLPPVILLFLLLASCASSPEQREARRAAAVESAKRLASCAVDGGLACAPETAALVGCALTSGLHCGPERRVWAKCLQARAIGCGVAVVGGLVSGAAADGPAIGDGCALGAAEVCADVAGDAAAVEACLGGSLVPCVD